MAANLTTDMVRAVLQLPERPYSDVRYFDSTSYYDLTQREVVRVLTCSGTASGIPKLFAVNTDFQLTAGAVDWTLPGAKPDNFSAFTVEYTHSPLGSSAAAQAVQTAQQIVPQDLGSAYPWGASTTSGIGFDALATLAETYYAAGEACATLAVSDVVNAAKYRRGSVLVDDTHKTTDWQALSSLFKRKYNQILVNIRPAGMVRAFAVTKRDIYQLVFDGDADFSNADQRLIVDMIISGNSYGGIL